MALIITNSCDGAQTLYAANNLNQYTLVVSTNGVTSPVHDANGNLVSDGTFTYTWDDENRLVSVARGDAVILENEYDTQSRRVRKITQSATHTFIYDGWNLVKETIVSTNGQTEIVDYVWGRDLSGTPQGAGGVGGLLAVRRNGAWFFPFYDNNGNIVAYVDSLGTLVASYTYDAFGNTIALSGTMADVFAHRFSTKYLDTETGFYYYGYRFYSPALSRWLNRDPIDESGGVNLYGFCGNNGIYVFDLLGHNFLSSAPFFRDVLEFLTGKGPKTRVYTYPDQATKELMNNSDVKMVYTQFKRSTCKSGKSYSYTMEISYRAIELDLYVDLMSVWGLSYNIMERIQGNRDNVDFGTRVMGSFGGKATVSVDCSKCTRTLAMTVRNVLSMESLTRNPFNREQSLIKTDLLPRIEQIFIFNISESIK